VERPQHNGIEALDYVRFKGKQMNAHAMAASISESSGCGVRAGCRRALRSAPHGGEEMPSFSAQRSHQATDGICIRNDQCAAGSS
jgi:hypothetical protein